MHVCEHPPSGLLGFGVISKKTGVKIDLFPAIIISFTINYSILGTFETHESFYVIEEPFVSEYFNACFHIFLIFNARAMDSIVRGCLLKANLWRMLPRSGRLHRRTALLPREAGPRRPNSHSRA